LLLRISFGFAVAKKCGAGEGYKSTRQCTVWKNGIRWLDLDGIETVVEMVERNRAVVVLMRGKMGSELKCVGLRSKLIHLVLEVTTKFCPNLKVDQYLLDPKDLIRQPYPFATRSLDTFTLYEMSTIVTSIVELKDWVFDTKGDSLCHLNDLLYFEPYTHLGVELLGRICADENEEVTDEKLYDFLHEYSQAHYTRGLELSEILKVRKPPLSPFTVTTPVSVFSFSCSSCSLNASGSHSLSSTSAGCTPLSHTDQPRKGSIPWHSASGGVCEGLNMSRRGSNPCMEVLDKWWNSSARLSLADFRRLLDEYSLFSHLNILDYYCGAESEFL
jgi:hypothetical protein